MASSNTITLGFRISALAIDIRCRWPPESFPPCSPTIVSSPSGSELIKSVRLAALTISSSVASSTLSTPYVILSLIVPENNIDVCGTTARCFLYERRSISFILCPSISTSPLLTWLKPITRLRIVDLPAPDSPTSAIVSPLSTWRLRLCRTGLSILLYLNVTSLKSNSPYMSLIISLPSFCSMSSSNNTSPIELTDSIPLAIVGIRDISDDTWLTIVAK